MNQSLGTIEHLVAIKLCPIAEVNVFEIGKVVLIKKSHLFKMISSVYGGTCAGGENL